MTPPDDDPHDGPEHDLYDETPPRSIFAATWFRALLVLIVLGVVGAVAVPFILDAMNPPPKPSVASRSTPPPAAPPALTPPPPAATPSPAPAEPAAPTTTATPADKTPDRTVVPDKADKPATAMPATPRRSATPDRTPAPADKMTAMPTVPDKPVPDKSVAEKPVAEKPAASKPAPEKKTAAVTGESKPKAATTKRAVATPTAPKGAASGGWWVQVGAFRDQDTAKKVAAKLREQNYKVEESVRGGGQSATTRPAAAEKPAPAASGAAPAGADQYDVFVSGLSAAELSNRLASRGLAAEATSGGAVIKPSLPLRDAVALSKDLAVDGFKVQVRRAGGSPAPAAPRAATDKPAEPAGDGGTTLYRVRVGAFPDRATARATLKELEGKGYKPFIARGGQ